MALLSCHIQGRCTSGRCVIFGCANFKIKRTESRWPLWAAAVNGVHPYLGSGSSVLLLPQVVAALLQHVLCMKHGRRVLGPYFVWLVLSRGHRNNFSSSTRSLSLDAELIAWFPSDGQNSKTTSRTFTGTETKISSSRISLEPSSTKNLCLNLEIPTFAAKACFTTSTVLLWNSSALKVASSSPEARKETSMASSTR